MRAKWQALDQLTTAFVLEAFRSLGSFSRAGERRSADEFINAFGVLPLYRKVVVRWLNRLADEGWLRREDAGFVADRPLPPVDLEAIRAGVAAEFHDTPGLLEYVERGGSRLVPVLTGREGSLETLFPGGSFALAEGLYETSPVPRYLNGIVRSVLGAGRLRDAGRRRAPRKSAPAGARTAAVVPALLPDRVVTTSPTCRGCFSAAEDRLKDYPFMRYELLISAGGRNQSLPASSFDVVSHQRRRGPARRQERAWISRVGRCWCSTKTPTIAWFDSVGRGQRFDDDVKR